MSTQAVGIESLWSQSDVVIKTVAVILLVMSISSWVVILVRGWRLLILNRLSNNTKGFWYTHTIEEGMRLLADKKQDNPFYNLAVEGKHAVDHHTGHKDDLHALLPLTEFLSTCLQHSIDETSQKLQSGLSIMASVGSTSPFIGLFGTVWGIYHALVGISSAGKVNISEVAGPIGEALIMTAFGLVVAIPAVLGYNAVTRGNKNLMNKVNRFAHELHAYYITGATPKKKGEGGNAVAEKKEQLINKAA